MQTVGASRPGSGLSPDRGVARPPPPPLQSTGRAPTAGRAGPPQRRLGHPHWQGDGALYGIVCCWPIPQRPKMGLEHVVGQKSSTMGSMALILESYSFAGL